MSTVHCPLCGLRFRYASELDDHAREHCVPHEMHLPPYREHRHWGEPAQHVEDPDDQERSKAIR